MQHYAEFGEPKMIGAGMALLTRSQQVWGSPARPELEFKSDAIPKRYRRRSGHAREITEIGETSDRM